MGDFVAESGQNIAPLLLRLGLDDARLDNASVGNEEGSDKRDVIWRCHRMDSPNPDNYHNWPPHSAWETYFEAGNLCSCLSDICEGRE